MSAFLGNTFRLGIKELRSLLADPVLLLLIVYTFTFAVYSVATGVKFEVQNASIAVVDEDQSEVARRIRGALLPPFFKEPVSIPFNEIDTAMDSGRFVFVIAIPPNFEKDLLAGRSPEIQLNIDATAMTQAGNGAVYLQNIISQEVTNFAQRREDGSSLPINLVVRAKFNPNLRVDLVHCRHASDQQHHHSICNPDGSGPHPRA